MATTGRPAACPLIPWTSVLPKPLENLEVPAFGGSAASSRVEATPLLFVQPLKNRQVPAPCGSLAHVILAPRAALLSCPT